MHFSVKLATATVVCLVTVLFSGFPTPVFSQACVGDAGNSCAPAAGPPGRHLKIQQAVCEIESGESGCDVFVSYNGVGSAPHCLFSKVDPNSNSAQLITCGSPTSIRVPEVGTNAMTLELRSGSMVYGQSSLIESRSVVGISGIQRSSYTLQDTRRSTVLRNSRATSLTTSWDSRIHFAVKGDNNGKRVSVVRMFRPERMDGQGAGSLTASNLFSSGHIFASDSMSNSEVSRSRINEPGDLGINRIGIEVPAHIAVYPDESFTTNPYRSNANGNLSNQGNFETYTFYVVMSAAWAGNTIGQYDVNASNPARGKKFFLTRFRASVVVRNARSNNAEIQNVIIHSQARPLTDTAGQLMYGYEPSVTLDGRMIIYSGNSHPSVRTGHGGEINYTWQQNQHLDTGWSSPRNLAEMYVTHGPGAGAGEARVSRDKLFSEHFPIAALPIKQYNGETLTTGDFIKGAYPWVSLKASEVFFQARATFHGPARSGATVVGYRTGGQLWHMDGDINNSRGNPTNQYDHWANGSGGGNSYRAIRNAYEARRFAGTNTPMGENSWTHTFYRPIAQYPTSWSAVTDLSSSPLPINPFPDSYGFWLSGNRYYEMSFPIYAKDLIAYYPMNEPLYQDQAMLRGHMRADSTDPGSEAVRRAGVDHVTNATADLSAHQHTATFQNGAQYPFEFYDVKNTWASRGVLRDQSEGAVGNSVFFQRNSQARSTLSATSLARIIETQSFSTAFWFNSSATNTDTRLLSLAGLADVSVNRNQLQVGLNTNASQQRYSAGISSQNNQWHHVAVTYRKGDLRLFFDGRQVARHSVNGDLLLAGGQANFSMGPAGTGAANLLLKLDEVYFYGTWLDATGINKLAYKKRVYNNSGNSFFRSSGMAGNYPRLPADLDLSYVADNQQVNLGEQLFNSTSLSRDSSTSCASCHQPAREFTDGQRTSSGINNHVGTVNTPIIANALLGQRFFYSGSASSVETQVIHTIMQNGEMGNSDASAIVASLPQALRDQMQSINGRPANLSDLAGALAAYVKTIRVEGSPDSNPQALTVAAQRGRRLFNGKANCVACHGGSNYTNNQYHDIGLGSNSSDRSAATDRVDDRFRHKTPTLRNIALTGPYFHDGSAADLNAVIDHYNHRSHAVGGKQTDALLHPLDLKTNEVNDLVEYLSSLNGATTDK